MRTLSVLLAGAALALGPATASAKELAAVKACGADGCRDVTALATHATLEGGPTASEPGRAAPFFRLEVTVRADRERVTWTMVYVPSVQKVRGEDGTWMSPAPATVRELDRLVRGRTPLPASDLGLAVPAAPSAPISPPPPKAAAPVAPSGDDDGLTPAVWAFLAAGVAGLLAAGAGATRTLRRRGAAPG